MVQRPWALPLSLHTPFVWALSWSFHRTTALSSPGEWSSGLWCTGEPLLARSKVSLQLASEGCAGDEGVRDTMGELEGVGVLLTKRLSLAQDKLLVS